MPLPDGYARIAGHCPMGCGQTLFLGSPLRGEAGRVTCSDLSCPSPTAVDQLLTDAAETEHLVSFTDKGFSIKHPLWERLDDALLDCTLLDQLRGLDGPPGYRHGRATPNGNGGYTIMPVRHEETTHAD